MQVVHCSDWMRGWGLGWHNALGRLHKLEDGWYLWKGKRQGRHNNIIRHPYTVTFKVLPDGSFEFHPDSKSTSLPDRRDVIESIRILNTPEPVKRERKQRKPNNTGQLDLYV